MADENKNYKTSSMGLAALKKAEVVIHTMPKNYLNSSTTGKDKSPKSTGILILGGGAVLLIVLFAAFYFFIVKNDNQPVETAPEQALETETSPQEKQTTQTVTQTEKQTLEEEVVEEEEEQKEDEEVKIIESEETKTVTSTVNSSETEKTNPVIVKPANDSDNDGLSDAEEKILGTNILNIDSDADSFDDFSELSKLYNPAGEGQLLTNSNIRKYTNAGYNYSLYYPLQWKWETIGGDESVIFKLENNQFIQIITQVNDGKQTIEEWYLEQFVGQPITPEQKLYKKGWTGIKSQDGLVVYLLHPTASHIFTITYNIGITSVTDYINIFMMMVESMAITN